MADAMPNPRRHSNLGFVLKPEAVEGGGRFKTDNPDNFHIRRRTKIIEISREMWRKHKTRDRV